MLLQVFIYGFGLGLVLRTPVLFPFHINIFMNLIATLQTEEGSCSVSL